MGAHMKKRILPVIIAILLILVIAGGALGKVLLDKYSYSKEEADWNEFYQVSESDRSAIILQDEMVEEQALIRDDVCYFDLATVHKYMNEVFYADMTEKLLLYANPTEVIRTTFGETSYTTTEGTQDAGYVISFVEGDTVYVAADYVKLFTNYSYDCYDRHVQVYTEWGTRQVAQLKKDTAVRLRGGVKSPILTQAAKGDTLEILEQMETWSKVKTADSVIGYVETIRDYLNRYLPDTIAVREVKEASPRFHARYNALGKTYRYICFDGPVKPVFDRKYVTLLDYRPDVERMQQAAAYLTGEHDFASFCGNPRMKKSTVRLVDSITVERRKDRVIFTFHGTGFLQNMVRILVGTLLEVGRGYWEPAYVQDILAAKDRKLAGPTAPPEGLCLMKVDY